MGRPWRNSDDGRAAVREVVEDRRARSPRAAAPRGAVELVRAVDGQELGGRARDPHDERAPVDVDPVVRVGEPVRQGPDRDRPAAPGVDPVDDLLDGDRSTVAHGVPAARFLGEILAQGLEGRPGGAGLRSVAVSGDPARDPSHRRRFRTAPSAPATTSLVDAPVRSTTPSPPGSSTPEVAGWRAVSGKPRDACGLSLLRPVAPGPYAGAKMRATAEQPDPPRRRDGGCAPAVRLSHGRLWVAAAGALLAVVFLALRYRLALTPPSPRRTTTRP